MIQHDDTIKGLFYDCERKRFRVRLYHDKQVFWLSYHKEQEVAIDTLEKAKKLRTALEPCDGPDPLLEPTTKTMLQVLTA